MALVILLVLVSIVGFPFYVIVRLADLNRQIQELKAQLEYKPRLEPPSHRLLDPDPLAERPTPVYGVESPPTSTVPPAPTPIHDFTTPVLHAPTPVYGSPMETEPPPPRMTPLEFEVAPASPPRSPLTLLQNLRSVLDEPAQATPQVGSLPSSPRSIDVESLLGANWLAKLGIAAIAVSAAFFLQYAFRNGWIGPLGQVGIGLFSAALMLGAGQFLLTKDRYRNYAQVLSSGGIVVYFLSIYAAYAFYHPRLLGFSPAFGALALGAIAASVLAMVNKTEVVALICILGAFATPILIRESGPTSGDSLTRLYTYLVALNVWVAVLTRLRPWHAISVVSFLGTWLIFFGAGPLKPSDWQAEGFASLFLLASVYFGMRAVTDKGDTLDANGTKPISDSLRAGVSLILGGCLAFAAASMMMLTDRGLIGMSDVALSGLLLGMVLAGLAVALPDMGDLDRQVRLIFGYSSAAAMVALIASAVGQSPVIAPEHIWAASGFALFNFLMFLGTALVMRRRVGEEGPAAVLVAANALIHIELTFRILKSTAFWGASGPTLWLPLAGWITLGGLWIATNWRSAVETGSGDADSDALNPGAAAEAERSAILPVGDSLQTGRQWMFLGALIASSHLLVLFGLIFAAPDSMDAPLLHWQPRSLGLVGAEFALLSATWLRLRNRIAWPAFRADIAAAFVNASVFFAIMARAVGMDQVQGISLLDICALAMAAWHAIVGAVVLKKADLLHRLTYLGLALTFVTIAIPLQLKASYITFAWAVEAAILIWTGIKVKEIRVRSYGLILFALAAVRALLFDLMTRPENFHPILNTRTLGGASIAAAAYVSAWWLWKSRELLTEEEHGFAWSLTLAANLFTLLFISFDLWDFAGQGRSGIARDGAQQLALSLLWTLSALVGVTVAANLKHRPLRIFAVGLLGVAAIKVLFFDLTTRPDQVQLFLNPRMIAGALVIAVAYRFAWVLWKEKEILSPEERFLPAAMLIVSNAYTLLFVSVDLWDFAGVRSTLGGTASAQQLALSLFWTVYALAGVLVGIWKRLKPVRLFAMGLLYLSIGKVFLFDLSYLETPYRIVSFFVLGVILLLVSLLYTKFEERMRADEKLPNSESAKPEDIAA